MSRAVRISLSVWPFIVSALVLLSLNMLERVLFPVIDDFTVTKVEVAGQTLRMSGYMRKERDCRFAGITAIGVAGDRSTRPLHLVFRDNRAGDSGSRPLGSQTWGPWGVTLPILPDIKNVELTSYHECHPFWASKTFLVSMPVIRPPVGGNSIEMWGN